MIINNNYNFNHSNHISIETYLVIQGQTYKIHYFSRSQSKKQLSAQTSCIQDICKQALRQPNVIRGDVDRLSIKILNSNKVQVTIHQTSIFKNQIESQVIIEEINTKKQLSNFSFPSQISINVETVANHSLLQKIIDLFKKLIHSIFGSKISDNQIEKLSEEFVSFIEELPLDVQKALYRQLKKGINPRELYLIKYLIERKRQKKPSFSYE
jgi:hypothetical protein